MKISKKITTEYTEFHGGEKDFRIKTPWYANRRFDVPFVVKYSSWSKD
jgi:hypothetical protein